MNIEAKGVEMNIEVNVEVQEAIVKIKEEESSKKVDSHCRKRSK